MKKIAILTLLGSVALLSVRQALPCELFGLSFNQPVSANRLFADFRCRSGKHPDGWGVAFYTDNSATLFKEAKQASESQLAEFLISQDALKAKLLIAHVRRASVGGQSHQNTHPFTRERAGRQYVLAHNGTLKGFREKLELGTPKPLGPNDSEFLLCYLVGRIEKHGVTEWNAKSFRWLEKEFQKANDVGSINCLLADGTHLFVYHDKNGFNSLQRIARKVPYGKVRFTSLGEDVDLSKIYPNTAAGVIIATKPLTDETWTPLKPGQLLVFKDGVQIFP